MRTFAIRAGCPVCAAAERQLGAANPAGVPSARELLVAGPLFPSTSAPRSPI